MRLLWQKLFDGGVSGGLLEVIGVEIRFRRHNICTVATAMARNAIDLANAWCRMISRRGRCRSRRL